MFCLYTGIVLFKDSMNEDLFEHFLNLSCAMRLLLHPNDDYVKSNANCSEILFQAFVDNFQYFYGYEQLSYNVHNIIHLTDGARMYGNLESFSCFKGENFMQSLKKKIKKPSQILEQIENRVYENWSLLNGSQKTGVTTSKSYSEGTLEMKTNFKDSCCLVDNVPFSIKKFVNVNGIKHIIGNRFTDPNDFFTRPVPSVDVLGIFQVKQLSDIDEMYEESHIQYKFMALPYKEDGFVLIPILHFFQ